MSSQPNDDLNTINALSSDLAQEYHTSKTSIDSINELIQKITSLSNIGKEVGITSDDVRDDSQEVNQDYEEDDNEIEELKQLKKENLELMLEIQREDFISRKWNEVLQQNQFIFDKLADWIKENSNLDTPKSLKLDFDEYLGKLRESKRVLEQELQLSELDIKKLVTITEELINILEDAYNNKDKFESNSKLLQNKLLTMKDGIYK